MTWNVHFLLLFCIFSCPGCSYHLTAPAFDVLESTIYMTVDFKEWIRHITASNWV